MCSFVFIMVNEGLPNCGCMRCLGDQHSLPNSLQYNRWSLKTGQLPDPWLWGENNLGHISKIYLIPSVWLALGCSRYFAQLSLGFLYSRFLGLAMMGELVTVLVELFPADRLNYVLPSGWPNIVLMERCVKLNSCQIKICLKVDVRLHLLKDERWLTE